jgi:glycosyltransferase involved in cell wall biosynthesis
VKNTDLFDVILFSNADWASKYWTNKQHIASRLADRGHRVLYVETVGLRRPGLNRVDLGRMSARLRRAAAPIAQVRDNLWVLSPLSIPFGRRHAMVNRFNNLLLFSRIRAWQRTHGMNRPLVWTYHPYLPDDLTSIGAQKLIYHCADDVGAIPGIDRQAFDLAEQALLSRADIVFTTSHRLQQRCTAVAGSRSHYFGNVADVAHFGSSRTTTITPPDLQAIPQPRLAYVGSLSDFKLDFRLLDGIAAERPQWQIVLIGNEREGQTDPNLAALAERPNVHLLGWRSYDTLPQYMAGFDVALLPQLINDYTQSMFPMKFFEYAAAGLPIVSTPLEALRDFAPLYSAATTSEGFIAAVSAILDAPQRFSVSVDDPILQENSWDRRLDRMLAVIDGASTNDAHGFRAGTVHPNARDDRRYGRNR